MQKKTRLLLLLITIITTLVSGWIMYIRMAKEQLWGHWPLGLFLGGWLSIVLIFEPRFSPHPRHLRLLALSTLSGILLWLGFPTIPLTTLMFVGFVPLLIVEKELCDYREEASKWSFFKYSYHALVLWNILTTFWVTNTAFVAGLFAIFANSLLMAIPLVLFHQVRKLTPKLGYMAFVAFWLTFEYWHLRQELSWPWLTLGNSFAEFPSWVQWYEYTGVFGGSLWILAVNVLFFHIVSPYYFHGTKIALKKLGKPLLIIILPILFSLYTYFSYEAANPDLEVVVVQPNFEPHYEKFSIRRTEQIRRFLSLSEKAITSETDYLVFPETSFGGVDLNKTEENPVVQELQNFVDKYPKLKLVTGIGARRIYGDEKPDANALRTYTNSKTGKVTYWEAYNAAIQVESGQKDYPFYLKSLLVPGAEFLPYRDVFFFAEPLVNKLGGTMAGYGTQEKRSVFTGQDGTKVAPIICYESVYGEYTTGYIREGAEALFIVTNDGWWDNTAGHRQHLLFATLRAIETRRSIARSANTGISGFINQRGDIVQASRYDEPIALNRKIAKNREITFYVRYRDIIGRLAIFMAILILLNAFVRGRLKKAEQA